MARPRKAGLDYFPFDVDFFSDEKVVCIGGEFGVKGELTIIKLLCAIYRNGYFTVWNESLKYKLKRELDGVSGELLQQIVQALVRRGFFDQTLFDSDSVLTSRGIQRRYFEATKFRTRDSSLPYLLDLPRRNYTKTDISHWETPVSQPKSTQMKRNKNKTSSDEDVKGAIPPPPPYNEKEFLPFFFGDDACAGHEAAASRKEAVEVLRISLGFPSMSAMREAAHSVVQEWKIRCHVPTDFPDAASHLISTLRKRGPSQAPAEEKGRATPGRPSAMADVDSQTAVRNAEFGERQRKAERPDDLIRRYGYDPAKVTFAQVFNPEWREANPPESFESH